MEVKVAIMNKFILATCRWSWACSYTLASLYIQHKSVVYGTLAHYYRLHVP